MIKKSFFVLLAATFFSVAANAALPFIDLGVKAGINNLDHDFNTSKITNDVGTVYGFKIDDKVGWHIGGQARINLMMFHLQPEILFSRNSYKLHLTDQARANNGSSSKVKINTIDVPVLFGVKMLIFRVQMGPMFTLMTDSSVSHGSVRDVTMSRPSVSYLIGLGADLSRFTVDVRYNGYFSRTEQTFLIEGINKGSEHRSKDSGLMFSMGYMF